ncbi:MAG: ABC transporter permease [Vicinamibacterales bacterium]
MLDALAQDVRYAVRGLWHAKAFSFIAIATLAVTIAGAVSVFSLIDGVLLRPLPYPQPDRLTVIHEVPVLRSVLPLVPVNAVHFREWRASATKFEQLAILGPMAVTLSDGTRASRVQGARVSPSLFTMLGVRPALGRLLTEDEDAPGRDQVVVLTDELWRDRFGADPSVVGRTVRLDGSPFEVIGVLPSSFRFPKLPRLVAVPMNGDAPLFFKPFAAQPGELRLNGAFNHIALGRLQPGATIEAAKTDLDGILAGVASNTSSDPFRVKVVELQAQLTGGLRAPLQLVFGASALVLLIACVNVANLLFARGLRRRRELSIRKAAGAGRARLAGQAVVEGLTLSVVASVIGVGLGAILLRVAMAYAPLELPGVEVVSLGRRALVFAALISGVAGLLIAILPAWVSGMAEPAAAIRETSRGVTSGRSIQRVRSLLVATEIAVSTVCLAASGLLLHSFVNLMNGERGFEGDGVLTATVNLTSDRYRTNEAQIAFYDTLLERAKAIPGVTGVGIIDRLPVSGAISNSALAVEGTSLPRAERPLVRIQLADPGYFQTMAIPLAAGRLYDASRRNARTAVVSERAARAIWPGENAIGKRFRIGPDDSAFIEVVGVVGDVQAIALGAVPPLSVYLPYWQLTSSQMSVAVLTQGGTEATSGALRSLITQLDPELAVPTVESMNTLVDASVTSRRFQMTLVLLLAITALTLAGLGVYAVMSQAVSQRTSEIGLRMAVGATPRTIKSMVLRNAALPVLAGFAAGALGSASLQPLIRESLFDVAFVDLPTFAGTLTFILTIAFLAAFVPARRAAALSPMDALRTE